MRHLFKFLFAAAALTTLFASCSKGGEPEEPVNPPIPLKIEADKTEIRADGNSFVTFTVIYGDQNVSGSAAIKVNGSALAGNTFKTLDEGDYSFQATYDGEVSNTLQVTAVASPPIILSADKQIVESGDQVTFTATYEGENVTDRISICITGTDGVCLLSNVYTAEALGQYNFYAYFSDEVNDPDHLVSNTVGVQVVADAENAVFEFHRNLSFFVLTATWCPPCSTLKQALHELTLNRMGGFNVVNFYSDNASDGRGGSDPRVFTDIFSPTIVSQIVDDGRFSFTGFPTVLIDFTTYFAGGPTYAQLLPAYDEWYKNSDVKTTGIQVNSEISGTTITVDVEVRAEEADTYSIGAVLVEDNILAPQSGLGNNYNHTNVFRAMGTENLFGEELGAMTAGGVATKTFTFTVDSKYNAENLSVLVYTLYDKALPTNNGGSVTGPVISNSLKARANGITGYQFAE